MAYDTKTSRNVDKTVTVLNGRYGTVQWATNFGSGGSISLLDSDWYNTGSHDLAILNSTVTPNQSTLSILNVTNGSIKWQAAVQPPYANSSTFGPLGLVRLHWNYSATPLDIDGDGKPDFLIYVSSPLTSTTKEHQVRVYDRDSKQLKWQSVVTSFMLQLLAGFLASTSAQGILTLSADYSGGVVGAQWLTVLDGKAGSVRWRTQLPSSQAFATASLIDWDNDGLQDVLVWNNNTITVFGGATGNVKWQCTPPLPSTTWALGQVSVNVNNGFRLQDPWRFIPDSIDGRSGNEILLTLKAGSASVSNIIQIMDVDTKVVKWQSGVIKSAFSLLPFAVDVNDRPQMEIVYMTYSSTTNNFYSRQLTVLDGSNGAATLLPTGRSSNRFQFTLLGLINGLYVTEYSINSKQWYPFKTNMLVSFQTNVIDLNSSTSALRFYRSYRRQ